MLRLVIVATVASVAFSAQGAVLVSEGFPTAGFNSGSFGEWNGSVQVGSLTYQQGGNELTVSGGKAHITAARRNLPYINDAGVMEASGTPVAQGSTVPAVWISFLHRNNNAPGDWQESLAIVRANWWGNDRIYMGEKRNDGSGNISIWGSGAPEANTTISASQANLFLIKIQPGAENAAKVWVNPVLTATEASLGSATFTCSYAGGVEALMFPTDGSGNTDIDEIRYATTLGEALPFTAVPEPGAITLVAFGALALSRRVRARAR